MSERKFMKVSRVLRNRKPLTAYKLILQVQVINQKNLELVIYNNKLNTVGITKTGWEELHDCSVKTYGYNQFKED